MFPVNACDVLCCRQVHIHTHFFRFLQNVSVIDRLCVTVCIVAALLPHL